MVFKLGRDFGKPIGQPDTYYVQCGTCERIEGQFVQSGNLLTFGIGAAANAFKDRGWRYEGGEWICPEC